MWNAGDHDDHEEETHRAIATVRIKSQRSGQAEPQKFNGSQVHGHQALTDEARSLGRGAIGDEEVTCGGPIQRELGSDIFGRGGVVVVVTVVAVDLILFA